MFESGLKPLLTRLGHSFVREEITAPDSYLAEIKTAFALCRTVADRVRAWQREGYFPIVLSGNCNTAVGTISGCGCQNTGVVWLDAHGESTTPDTTTSGFLDGMGISILTGQCWTTLARTIPGFDPVPGEHILLVESRDLEPDEVTLLDRTGVTPRVRDRAPRTATRVLGATKSTGSICISIWTYWIQPKRLRTSGRHPARMTVEAMKGSGKNKFKRTPESKPSASLRTIPKQTTMDERWPRPHLVTEFLLGHRELALIVLEVPSAWVIAWHIDIRHTFAYAPGMAITRRQRELYDFISRFVAEKQYSPSFEEIKEGMGLNSLATVHKHVTNLEKKGLLTRDYNRSRSIDLLPPRGKLKQSMAVNTAMVLPLVGRIAAGRPIEAVEHNETISLADFVRSKEVFVLEVRGESMQDEAILDGDYVLVEKTKTAHNGDIVVALIDSSDATLKRFFREGDNIRLQPSNAAMKPIIVPAASVEIQGRVIGVLRKY